MLQFEAVRREDPAIAEVLDMELRRQQDHIELIASENIVSEAVMEALGSHLTNKYAEGYPAKRFYGGCEAVDKVEEIAIERAKKLFGAEHANVQPHSGAQANGAVYLAFLKPGDRILGLDLSNGGHLTHGSPANSSGKLYESHFYTVDPETEVLDYDEIERQIFEVHPKMVIAGASAYSRTWNFERIKASCDKIGCLLLVDMAHVAGLVAAGLHPSPVPHADIVTTTTHKTLRGPRGGLILCKSEYAKAIDSAVFPGMQGGPLMHAIASKAVCLKEAMEPEFVEYQRQVLANAKAMAERLAENGFKVISGGTDNHMMLVDVTTFNTTGKEVQNLLDRVHITLNKNTIPKETLSPFVTSGVRIGTPAITSRGMKEKEAIYIADLIAELVKGGESKIEEIKAKVIELCERFPIYK